MSKYEKKCSISLSKQDVDNALKEIDNDDVQIGMLERQTEAAHQKKTDDIRLAKIVAANFFTKEKIAEIHSKSISVLKSNDFNEDDYISIFSDTSRIELEHIEFLMEKLEYIEKTELKLNNNTETSRSWLYDLFHRGGVDND